MNIINLENITKTYTERKLLQKASFYLAEGEKVGVIGINGTGKSTLLKIIAGLEEPDEGTVVKANHLVVRYLPQNPAFDPEHSVLESVLAGCGQDTEHWNLESDAKTLLTKLGITDFSRKTGELSGGQRKRLALAAAVLTPCDVLLLDEPTNHLDSAMADWLEDFL
ncbi:MAG: ATP-binding cassette domain-containing protein, partial [Roseburia sp.]